MFDGKSILVTGGTGSFGNKFVEHVLKNHDVERLIVFSRDELKQHRMGEQITRDNVQAIRLGYGLPPKALSELVVQESTEYIKRGTPLSWKLVTEIKKRTR